MSHRSRGGRFKNSVLKKREAEALIIAEITGSITAPERYKLNAWRKQCQGVQNISAEFHEVLDPVMADLMETKITAAQTIEKGNAQLARERRQN
jgi:hypothetical protein